MMSKEELLQFVLETEKIGYQFIKDKFDNKGISAMSNEELRDYYYNLGKADICSDIKRYISFSNVSKKSCSNCLYYIRFLNPFRCRQFLLDKFQVNLYIPGVCCFHSTKDKLIFNPVFIPSCSCSFYVKDNIKSFNWEVDNNERS